MRSALIILTMMASMKLLLAQENVPKSPKNIVFIIGDGMGLSQVSASLYSHTKKSVFESFPIIGFQKTHASNNLITDSAAGATAMACGCKTFLGALGLCADSTRCKTILEHARDRNLATGLVATSTIVHATPAAFVSHRVERYGYEPIALDVAVSNLDLWIGGGSDYFLNRATDNRNLLGELKSKGYKVELMNNEIPFSSLKLKPEYRYAVFTSEKDPPLRASMGRDYLPWASAKACSYLGSKSDDGFFLMIEGSQIDWACHQRDGEWMLSEMEDLERTIQTVLAFAKEDGETLVVVTADHETGGMGINSGSRVGRLILEFTTNSHTASMIPVFAYGPGAEYFSGMYENTQIFHKMVRALGWVLE